MYVSWVTYLLLVGVVELLLGNCLHSLGELRVRSGVGRTSRDCEHRLVRPSRPLILRLRRVRGIPRSIELVVVAESRMGDPCCNIWKSSPIRRLVEGGLGYCC